MRSSYSESLKTDVRLDDLPVGMSLERRQPKKYPLVWITELGRPVLHFYDEPDEAHINLYTCGDLANAAMCDMAQEWGWNLHRFVIRKITLVDAFTLAREMELPIELTNGKGTCRTITGVMIEALKYERFYPL